MTRGILSVTEGNSRRRVPKFEINDKMRKRSRTSFGMWCLLAFLGLTAGGCQTLSAKRSSAVETRQAITSVAAGLAGRPLTPQEARELEQQIRTDPGARSAIRKIAASMSEAPKSKYCPVDGARYAPHLKICPVHNVPLKEVTE